MAHTQPIPTTPRWPRAHLLTLLALWLAIFVAALSTPPLLDDADATHAQAAQAMLSTGDWVTLHVDGIRYLEKPPLPYWLAALSLRLFATHTPYAAGQSSATAATFAIHLPLALTILALALLGYEWARRAFNPTTALYTALFLLTSTGVFLFTRVFIPDALLSLLLAFSLYALLRSLESPTNAGAPRLASETWVRRISPDNLDLYYPYLIWLTLALAVLTKGLVTLVFFFTTATIFLLWTNQLHLWRRLRPFSGLLLFLAVAAPWHILAGLRNTAGSDGHGFFWFYFINEHVLRFLGRRIPRDYNKLPAALYWSLHLVWLFPWSLFAPAALLHAWRHRRELFFRVQKNLSSRPEPGSPASALARWGGDAAGRSGETRSSLTTPSTFALHTILLLLIFSALVLLFFSLSTNQEYYTFPVYLPLLLLLAAALERTTNPGAPHLDSEMWVSPETKDHTLPDPTLRRTLTFAFASFTLLGLAISAALAYGLWSARHLPFVPDIGELLAHRGVGDYTVCRTNCCHLTGPSFAALRLPATLALLAFLLGPPTAWFLHTRRRPQPAILTIALTSTIFLIAAHIALVRFSPMLSSANFAETIQSLEDTHRISPTTQVLLYGDQAYGSSIPFYLDRHVLLVDGRSTSMLFGSTFPDAPPIFLTPADLLAQWGTGPRKLLFVPLEKRDTVDQLLGPRQIILQQTSGKALITDRPLDRPQPPPQSGTPTPQKSGTPSL